MAGTYKIIELVGHRPMSFAEAVRAAVAEAAKTVRNMSWFEVVAERGRIEDGKVTEFQVTIKIGIQTGEIDGDRMFCCDLLAMPSSAGRFILAPNIALMTGESSTT